MLKLPNVQKIVSSALFWVFFQGNAMAQPTMDKLLASVNVSGSPKCSHIELKLNRPINVNSVFPPGKGIDLVLRVELLATTQSDDEKVLKEAASVPPQNPAGLGGAIFDFSGASGPEIHFIFAKPVAYKLKRDTDNRHILVDVGPADAGEICLGLKSSVSTDDSVKGDLASQSEDQNTGLGAEAALADGKKQLSNGDYNRATAFFTKAEQLGSGRIKQDAQEMLGLSHERANQLPFAKAEYETYLQLYSGSPDAARVKQRLAGVVAALENQANQQFALRQAKTNGTVLNSDKGDLQAMPPAANNVANVGQGNGVHLDNTGLRANIIEEKKDPNAWTWQKNGSFAQYYYRDDNFLPATIGGPLFGNHQSYQNEVISTADAFIAGENKDYSVEARISANNEQGLGDQANIAGSSISSVYIDGKLKGPRVGLRAGRQSKSTGGVFGRFDGGVLSWEPKKNIKLQAVGGAPVMSRNAAPFSDNRYFYGVSAEYTSDKKDWSADLYAIQQNVGDIIDRRALGGEARYNGQKVIGYAAADYDIYFNEFNNAYLTSTWLPRQGTSIYATLDYRKVPFLVTSNAMMGQNFASLQMMVDAVGLDTVNEWAGDRTASAKSMSAGMSQQLNEKWQASVDATLAYYTGTPASGGVAYIPDPGFDFYGSLTMSGSGVFKQNDSLTGSLRFAWSETATTYMADANYRLPIGDKLRLGPRFRVSLRNSSISDQIQYLVMPSLTTSYRINKNWSVESEIGARFQDTVTNGLASPSLDILGMAGYRYDFN